MVIDIGKNTIIFDEYDLDHVVTGYGSCDSIEEMIEESENRLQFEGECSGGYSDINLLNTMKCSIPQNADIKHLKGTFDNFKTLIEALFKYQDNGKVFPYLVD